MTPKYLDICVTQYRGRSHRSYRIIHHRSKEFVVPMTSSSPTPRGRPGRGAQPLVQQHVGLHALKRLCEAKGFNSDLLRDVRRRAASKVARWLVSFLRL